MIEQFSNSQGAVDYLSWRSRIFLFLLLFLSAVLTLFNGVFIVSGVSMRFPASRAMDAWVYMDLILAGLLILTSLIALVPRFISVKIGAVVSALSAALFSSLAAFVTFNILGGEAYRTLRLIDIAILVGLPLILSATIFVLQINILRKQRSI